MILNAGSKLDNYKLEKKLGDGASGEVWKASDGSHMAALKIMHESLQTHESASNRMERWQREADALEQLNHPNIPKLYGYNFQSHPPYLAMQYIDDSSYDKKILIHYNLVEQPLKRREIFKMLLPKRVENIRQLAMALWAAHQAGIIHRDIKPANIAGVETPYLLDFSIAFETQNLQKKQNKKSGTILYMPWDGNQDKLGDIYSFGLVAYEILFAQHAIFTPTDLAELTADAAQKLASKRIRDKTWRRPTQILPGDLPADLQDVGLRSLEAIFECVLGERDKRYEDPRKFAEKLSETLITSHTQSATQPRLAAIQNPGKTKLGDEQKKLEIRKPSVDEGVTQLGADSPGLTTRTILIAVAIVFSLAAIVLTILVTTANQVTGNISPAISATPSEDIVVPQSSPPPPVVVPTASALPETPTAMVATVPTQLPTTVSIALSPTWTPLPIENKINTPIPVSPAWGDEIRLANDLSHLREAIADSEHYDCVVFNQIYERIKAQLNNPDTDYAEYGTALVGQNALMTNLYNHFCKDNNTQSALLPIQYENENDQMQIMVIDILKELQEQAP